MKTKQTEIILKVLLSVVIGMVLQTFIIYYCYNWLMPLCFDLPPITIPQSITVLVLKIIFIGADKQDIVDESEIKSVSQIIWTKVGELIPPLVFAYITHLMLLYLFQ